MPKYIRLVLLTVSTYIVFHSYQPLVAQPAKGVCPRPPIGSVAGQPEDLRSQKGVLQVTLTANNAANPDGSIRYCFTDAEGRESPTLRVSPGDLVILHLKNALSHLPSAQNPLPATPTHVHSQMPSPKEGDGCTNGAMIRKIFRQHVSWPVEIVIAKINPVLRGWVNYFRYGHSSSCFQKSNSG